MTPEELKLLTDFVNFTPVWVKECRHLADLQVGKPDGQQDLICMMCGINLDEMEKLAEAVKKLL